MIQAGLAQFYAAAAANGIDVDRADHELIEQAVTAGVVGGLSVLRFIEDGLAGNSEHDV